MRFGILILAFLLISCGGGGNETNNQTQQPEALYLLPQTGQTTCYEIPFNGNIIPCSGTGQDGEVKAGVSWPTPRFTSDTLGLVRDELTGLEWSSNRNAPGPATCLPAESKTWEEALNYIACINQNSYLGHNDWHLPNVVELSSLLNADLTNSFKDQFDIGSWGYWWTSTTIENGTTNAYTSLAEGGYISSKTKSELLKVWPVRNAEAGTITLHQTGQTNCYDSLGATIDCTGTGQDGEMLAGRQWPDPRFTDNGDGTITDNLTNVIWTKNTDFPYSEVCSPGDTDFPSSVDYIKCLNNNMYLGQKDWRLPNEFEIRSLRDYSLPSDQKSNWLAGYGFYNFSSLWVQSWSSTVEDSSGWPVGVWVGGGHWESSFQYGHVWPVRSVTTP